MSCIRATELDQLKKAELKKMPLPTAGSDIEQDKKKAVQVALYLEPGPSKKKRPRSVTVTGTADWSQAGAADAADWYKWKKNKNQKNRIMAQNLPPPLWMTIPHLLPWKAILIRLAVVF